MAEEMTVVSIPESSNLLSIRQAAHVLGISESTAYELVGANDFPVPLLRVGRRYKVARQALDSFIASGTPARSA